MSGFRAEPVLRGLKDFQRATVDVVFERLYGESEGSRTHRFLVADEVGLGKTLVARGVIARAVEHLEHRSSNRVDIIYVCSNAQIARQNVRRLFVHGEGHLEVADRLTMLPTGAHDLARNRVNIVSFTPGTSFELKGGSGQARERAVLRLMLAAAWGDERFRSRGSMRLFQGGVQDLDRFAELFRSIKRLHGRQLDPSLVDSFRSVVGDHDRAAVAEGRPSLQERFDELSDIFAHARPKTGWHRKHRSARNQLIGDLRHLLARACLQALQPDLIILDEFQRFKHLLAQPDGEETSPAAELAHELFAYVDEAAASQARVLLLSATPYRMLTASGEVDDDHHADLVKTVAFLLEYDDAAVAELRDGLEKLRRGLLQVGVDAGAAARRAKARVESILRRVMVRTERLGSTKDRSGMLEEARCDGLRMRPADVSRYVAGARLARCLDSYDPIDYWLSSPHILNYMDGYHLRDTFDQRTAPDGVEDIDTDGIGKLAADSGLLDWGKLRAFESLDVDNARLRWLLHDTAWRGVWQLLWMPPSLPYLAPGGPYAQRELQHFTKRLIFSSWTLVPKSIATLVSYEIERRRVSCSGEPAFENSRESRDARARLLDFPVTEDRPRAMSVFAILYPSAVLAREGDPLALCAGAGGQLIEPDQAVEAVAGRMRIKLDELQRDMARKGTPPATAGRADERWYWAAPLLLDRLDDPDATDAFFDRTHHIVDAFTEADPSSGGDQFREHVIHARDVVRSDYPQMGAMPEDLPHVLARQALTAPGVCALRSLVRISHRSLSDTAARMAACGIAWGIRSLFNAPQVIELVRSLAPGKPYWQQVLDYALCGNLQAVLDEYTHVLAEARGHLDSTDDEAIRDIASAIHSAAQLRVVNYVVRRIETHATGVVANEADRLRAHCALRLSDEKGDDGTQTRVSEVREAFNSPFQPFVLATTSAGQEGLDFHLFCHAIVHWNLPGNPVDLEQREGRVHRYKGHAVRRNIARQYATIGRSTSGDPWESMFAAACEDRPPEHNEIWPYWVYTPDSESSAKIERYVPSFALSRDRAKAHALQRSIALYRVAFGQPRQDDLLAYLSGQIDPNHYQKVADDLRIDLTPG